jgi:hypothetical protein
VACCPLPDYALLSTILPDGMGGVERVILSLGTFENDAPSLKKAKVERSLRAKHLVASEV